MSFGIARNDDMEKEPPEVTLHQMGHEKTKGRHHGKKNVDTDVVQILLQKLNDDLILLQEKICFKSSQQHQQILNDPQILKTSFHPDRPPQQLEVF